MARPVTRRRSRDEDVPETSRYAAEPDEDVEEDDTEEEEAPRRRDRRGTENRRPAGRRSRSDEDGDRTERRRGRSSTKAPERGWKALDEAKTYSENLKFDDGEVLLKFVEEDPYASFRQHFLKEATGRKSFNCIGEGCPLCDALGDEPRWLAVFNVIDLSDPKKPELKTWQMGKKLATKLAKLAEKPRTSPLNREDLYFSVDRTGKGLTTDYTLEAVLAGDLDEYYDTTPLDAATIEDLAEKVQGPEDVKYDSLEFLEEIADDLS